MSFDFSDYINIFTQFSNLFIFINLFSCIYFVLTSIKNNSLLSFLIKGKFSSSRLGIFSDYKLIIKSKNLILSNWGFVSKNLKSKWNNSINIILFLSIANPIIMRIGYISIDYFYNFVAIEAINLISIVFIMYKKKNFFFKLEQYLNSESIEYSSQEINSLLEKLEKSQKTFDESQKTNENLLYLIENISKQMIDITKISYASKELLENIGNHIVSEDEKS